MDDKNFDEKSANDWINLIESQPISKRDEDIYPRINNWIIENGLKRILDLGCGQGICYSKLDLSKTDYSGVDPSEVLVNRAKEINSNCTDKFFIGNVYSLPFDSGSFDGVFSIAVWHLLENLEKASQQLASVLQNNGRFLIVLASRKHFDDWTAAYQSIENNDPQFIGKNNNGEVQDVIYLYSDSDLKEVLLKYNLEVSSIDRIRIWTVLEGFKKF